MKIRYLLFNFSISFIVRTFLVDFFYIPILYFYYLILFSIKSVIEELILLGLKRIPGSLGIRLEASVLFNSSLRDASTSHSHHISQTSEIL